jgi:hypothetical protein
VGGGRGEEELGRGGKGCTACTAASRCLSADSSMGGLGLGTALLLLLRPCSRMALRGPRYAALIPGTPALAPRTA